MEDQTTRTPTSTANLTIHAEAALRSYRFAAAVLSRFDSESLHPIHKKYANDSDAVLDLLEECERIRTEQGDGRWMLKNSIRQQTLKELGTRSAIGRALRANTSRPTDTLQRMFEAYIARSTPLLEQQTIEELIASLQIRDWLDGVLDGLFNREKLTNRLEWQQLLQPFRQLVGEYFRGRSKELADLRKFFAVSQKRRSIYQAKPLMIFGPGGVGKSTLLAKFILETVDEVRMDNFAFCYWDFDRATLLPEEPVTLLAELVLQLGLQFPQLKQQTQTLRQRWLNELSESATVQRTIQTEAGTRGTVAYRDIAQRAIHEGRSDLSRYLNEFATLISGLPRAPETRLMLVLDTFERVQEVSFEFTLALWEFLNNLQSLFPLMRVIVAGRVQLSKEIAHEPYELKELDEEAANGYLVGRGSVNSQLADAIYKRVGGDPLSLRLVLDGLRQEHDDLSKLTELPTDFDGLSIDHELNQGWLYRRYLSRVNDPEIRRLAHPGLILRRVTPELIREVLAMPCKVAVPSDDVAKSLFERLAQQVSLVTREGQWTLRHRADVRKRMLRSLVQTEGPVVFDIERRAIDYYSHQPANPDMRAEEIYHRLFTTINRDEIDARWMPGVAKLLRDAVDEIPPEMRSYLISKLKTTSLKFDWNEADARSKEDFVATRAQDAITVNKLTDALLILSEVRERLPGSKLFRLEAQSLERLGRYPEARIVANEGLFSARKAGDVELELDLLFVALRANEILGQFDRASTLLEEAMRLDVKLQSPDAELLALELLMHRLRICRLDPANCNADISTLRRTAYESLNPLFDTAARQNSILLLKVIEEIGVEYSEMIVRTVALFKSIFDTETSQQQLVSLLREWSDTLGGRRNPSTNTLVNIAKLFESGQREQAMQSIGLTLTDGWARFFAQLFQANTLTQPVVSRLCELIRLALTGAQQTQTATSALVAQVATALLSAFETRDELMAFLQAEFPEHVSNIASMTTFNDAMVNVATLFERQGQTEKLIERALVHQPDNALLKTLHEQLSNVVSRESISGSYASTTLVGGADITVEGDVISGNIVTSGGNFVGRDFISGNVSTSGGSFVGRDFINSTVHIFNRSVSQEELKGLPKSAPPFTIGDPSQPVLAAPELVFNWALGMRQAMRSVCLLEASNAIGTGFLVAPNLLFYPSYSKEWRGVRARFDHCHLPDGSLGSSTVYVLAEDGLVMTSKDLGYSLLRLEGTPGTDLVPGENVSRGWLSLTSTSIIQGQSLFMLHNALGGPQMLEYAYARSANNGTVELATLSGIFTGGTGGAPICNDAWQLIAVRIGTKDKRLLVIWASDLLADVEFTRTLFQFLPDVQIERVNENARPARLRQTLVENFDIEDLMSLSFYLNIDWDKLGGETRSEKAQSLIKTAIAQNKLDVLVKHGMELRPSAKWQ